MLIVCYRFTYSYGNELTCSLPQGIYRIGSLIELNADIIVAQVLLRNSLRNQTNGDL